MAESEQINRLYWETDRSVADIADDLGVSRRSLYDSIEPRPTGAPCPECGDALVFRNRTAVDNLEAECQECGRSVELDEAESATGPGDLGQETVAGQIGRARPRAVPTEGSGALLSATLLAGLLVGASAGYLARRL